jgi:hypothetical protein
MALALAGCAAAPTQTPEQAAKNRPLEERCARAHPTRNTSKPGLTQAEVQAEARAAARRGELDKACDAL